MIHEPDTYEETIQYKHSRIAISEELQALAENNIWTIMPRTKHMKPIEFRYVFKTKLNSDGKIDTRPGLWPKDTHKNMAWITQRPLVLLQS